MQFSKFVSKEPELRNAIDIFDGRWASAFETDDVAAELRSRFDADPRPHEAIRAFGADGRLDGVKVLELGPFEAGHSYALEKSGAQVTAIEGNAEAYMKCLIVKECLQLRARFLLGNFLPMLEDRSNPNPDMVFASGILYHMPDPLRLLQAVADSTQKAYFWTHYFDPADPFNWAPEPVERNGAKATYYRIQNTNSEHNDRWWGGLYESTCWISKKDMFDACSAYGFRNVRLISDSPYALGASAHCSFICEK